MGETEDTKVEIQNLMRTVRYLDDKISALVRERNLIKRTLSDCDCRYTGGRFGDISGSHCPPDKPCIKCQLSYAVSALEAIAEKGCMKWVCVGNTGEYCTDRSDDRNDWCCGCIARSTLEERNFTHE